MRVQSALFERDSDMRLPYFNPGKCINHPTKKTVQKYLCSDCLVKWEKTVLNYEAIQQGEVLSPE